MQYSINVNLFCNLVLWGKMTCLARCVYTHDAISQTLIDLELVACFKNYICAAKVLKNIELN